MGPDGGAEGGVALAVAQPDPAQLAQLGEADERHHAREAERAERDQGERVRRLLKARSQVLKAGVREVSGGSGAMTRRDVRGD